jgi:hypothetical protein
MLLVILFLLFYKVQSIGNCKYCKYLQCVPYTSTICQEVDG